jgi:hypothetical protein
MGRFPVTLYKEQWLKLLNMSDDIRAFIAVNEAQLKAKDCVSGMSSKHSTVVRTERLFQSTRTFQRLAGARRISKRF